MTPKEVRGAFFAQGVSIAAWARERGFSTYDVYAALAGRTRGARGKAHEIAVALGLKPTPAPLAEAPFIRGSRSGHLDHTHQDGESRGGGSMAAN
ncbi:DNA-binding protein [Nevskia soli]|uniref:DNA-binding protein n=1 Tax=Nevskia soli TaxID=418856 RepID=UPI000A00636E